MLINSKELQTYEAIKNSIVDVSRQEISYRTGLKYTTVQKHFRKLENKGEIKKVRKISNTTTYHITDDNGELVEPFKSVRKNYEGRLG